MDNEKLDHLIQAVRLVAQECPEQIASLPDFVVVPDEVALILNDALLTFQGSYEVSLLDSRSLQKIKELDRYFDDLGKEEFTLGALCNSARWSHARNLASEILAMLGAPKRHPDLSWIRFVPGAPS